MMNMIKSGRLYHIYAYGIMRRKEMELLAGQLLMF